MKFQIESPATSKQLALLKSMKVSEDLLQRDLSYKEADLLIKQAIADKRRRHPYIPRAKKIQNEKIILEPQPLCGID